MPSILLHPFLDRGFRPFFFAGALYSVLILPLWLAIYSGNITSFGAIEDPMSWHAHEMIFGFAVAIVAGFLLTAVANWTGGAPVRHGQLLGLLLLWCAGRVVISSTLPFWLVATIEGSFLPALAVSLAIPLLKTRNVRNFIFLFILTALFVCDMSFLFLQTRTPLYVALGMIVLMVSLIGGRVIPAFTVASLRRRGFQVTQRNQTTLDGLAVFSLILLFASIAIFGIPSFMTAGAAFTSATIHLLRMRHYHTKLARLDPMIWILHAGFAWVILGLFMTGLAALDIVPFSIALHAITTGALGSMTLGMMCRVTLGHTGRDISASRLTTLSFATMQIASLLRVFAPLTMPESYVLLIIVSGILWASCFAAYLSIYAPLLFKKTA